MYLILSHQNSILALFYDFVVFQFYNETGDKKRVSHQTSEKYFILKATTNSKNIEIGKYNNNNNSNQQ